MQQTAGVAPAVRRGGVGINGQRQVPPACRDGGHVCTGLSGNTFTCTELFLNAHLHRRCREQRLCIGLSVLKHAFGIINITLYVLVII